MQSDYSTLITLALLFLIGIIRVTVFMPVPLSPAINNHIRLSTNLVPGGNFQYQ